jgi:hypothetical protein
MLRGTRTHAQENLIMSSSIPQNEPGTDVADQKPVERAKPESPPKSPPQDGQADKEAS